MWGGSLWWIWGVLFACFSYLFVRPSFVSDLWQSLCCFSCRISNPEEGQGSSLKTQTCSPTVTSRPGSGNDTWPPADDYQRLHFVWSENNKDVQNWNSMTADLFGTIITVFLRFSMENEQISHIYRTVMLTDATAVRLKWNPSYFP